MDRSKFFASIRSALFDGRMSESQVKGVDALLDAIPAAFPLEHLGYALATTYHETGRTMLPIVENLNYRSAARIRDVWPSRFPTVASAAPYVGNPRALANKVYGGRMGNVGADDGWTYRGRGDAMITGRDNYARAGKALGVDLVAHPELAERPDISASILYRGMTEGWFTGKKLSDYFRPGLSDPYNARRIINGLDRASDIARFFRYFVAALKVAGYEPAVLVVAPPGPVPVIDAVPPPPDIAPAEDMPVKRSVADALRSFLETLFGRKSA